MNKVLVLSVIVLLSLPIAAHAAAIGAAETLGEGEFSISLGQEMVFERKLKGASSGVTEIRPKVDKAYRTMIKASYGLLDNLDIYARFGMAKFDIKQKEITLNNGPSNSNQSKKGNNAFAYGFGIKGAIFLVNRWVIGADAQYLRHRNTFKYSGLSGAKGKMTLYEWHIAPYVAKQLDEFTPYLGVRYSDAQVKSGGIEFPCNWKSKAKRNFGVFVGTDYKIDENWSLNIEGRFLDETAMSAAATYRF